MRVPLTVVLPKLEFSYPAVQLLDELWRRRIQSPLLIHEEHLCTVYRQLYMNKSRIALYLLISLIIIVLGGMVFFRSLKDQEPVRVFSATVDRDCAPWDGAAFTVTVEYDPSTKIHISIWEAPDFPFPAAFSLPDAEGQVGNAYILPELGPYTPLTGDVTFQRVREGMPLEGRFSFTSERGERYEGSFAAEWGNQIVMCG